jgi:EAL domain-containing protein (putative c-di-GMP-specific phosphodiesterase class I)
MPRTVSHPDTLPPGEHDAGPRCALSARIGLALATEYQPIIDVRSRAVVAHEALARFEGPAGRAVPPGAVFAALHTDRRLLFEVELHMKRLQIQNAPGPRVFVNLDPDGFAEGDGPGGNPLLDVLSAEAPVEVVVEVIENMQHRDAQSSRRMIDALAARGVAVALDDIGAEDALLSLDALFSAGLVKLDRSVLRRLGHPRRRAVYEGFVRMAGAAGLQTVLEGVETEADLVEARRLGVDLVQGFLFRSEFHSVAFV